MPANHLITKSGNPLSGKLDVELTLAGMARSYSAVFARPNQISCWTTSSKLL
jgi:hypothetical protein